VGLDAEICLLFQQYHLPYLPELASLNGVDVHSSGYRLTKVVGGIPLDRTIANDLSFQILYGGEGFTKESKIPYAPKGKYVFDTLHLWVLL